MVLGQYYTKGIVFLTMAILVQGCGSVDSSNSEKEVVNSSHQQLSIDEKNYLKVSKYIYARKQAYDKLNDTKTPNKTRRDLSNKSSYAVNLNSKILKVDAKNDRMVIKQNGKTVLVNVDKKNNQVAVSYGDGSQNKKQVMILDKFTDLN
jgi:hypothetical protein